MNLSPEQRNSLKKEMVSVAKGQIGVHEEGGNNLGPMIREYQMTTTETPGAWSWCAAFMSWVLFTAATSLKLPGRTAWRCRSALAFAWEKWAKEEGLTVLDESSLAQAGDIVVFDFSHIGIVVRDQKPQERTITVCEGNTPVKLAGGGRDSETGDGVMQKVRDVKLVKCYIRF